MLQSSGPEPPSASTNTNVGLEEMTKNRLNMSFYVLCIVPGCS